MCACLSLNLPGPTATRPPSILTRRVEAANMATHSTTTGPVTANPVYNGTSKTGIANNHPVGNGELVANVWAENSTVGLLLGRSDVFSGYLQPLKLGRVLLTFDPDPFAAGSATYTQELDLATATVVALVRSGTQQLRISIWSDATALGSGADSLHVTVNATEPVVLTATIDRWRTQFVNQTENAISDSARGPCTRTENWGDAKIPLWPDTIINTSEGVLPAGSAGWYYRNTDAQFAYTLDQQMMSGFAGRVQDPLLGRTSGALVAGGTTFNTTSPDGTTIVSTAGTEHMLTIFTNTAITASAGAWLAALKANASAAPTASASRPKHEAWWAAFWRRSWILMAAAAGAPSSGGSKHVPETDTATGTGTGTSVAAGALSQAYDLTRYLTAIQSRGQLPTPHNGGTVCWGWNGTSHDNPDRRPWGGGYWFQNTRHMYYYALGAGYRPFETRH